MQRGAKRHEIKPYDVTCRGELFAEYAEFTESTTYRLQHMRLLPLTPHSVVVSAKALVVACVLGLALVGAGRHPEHLT